MEAPTARRKWGGQLSWGLLTLIAVALMYSGIGPLELLGDALIALCLLKAGLKVHGHVIGGGPRRRPRFGSQEEPARDAGSQNNPPHNH